MGIRAALAALFGRARAAALPAPEAAKASATGPVMAYAFLGRPVWTERRYDALAAEGFARNVVAHRAVQVIARGAAAVPWLLYKGERELDAHPLLALLRRPNPRQSGAALFEALFGQLLIAGNAWLEAVGPEGGSPRELHALRPDRMSVVPGPAGLPAAYEHRVGSRVTRWPVDALTGASPILHLKSFHPLDDWYGLSPLAAAANAVDQHNAAGAWNQALLQNGARPSGALVFAPREGSATLGEERFRRLKEQIEEQFAGSRNAGRPLLLEGGLDWREMSLSPKDMDFINAKLTAARDVACALGVPPMLVGVPGDATYANYREARLALWEDTIIPLLDRVTEELNAWLAPQLGEGLRLGYDLDQVSALQPRREAAYARVQGADFLTVNEKREAVGYAPVEGGDGFEPPEGPSPGGDGSPDAAEHEAETAALSASIDTKLDQAALALDRGDHAEAHVLLGDAAIELARFFDPLKHPRWPAGDPQSRGGEFRPADGDEGNYRVVPVAFRPGGPIPPGRLPPVAPLPTPPPHLPNRPKLPKPIATIVAAVMAEILGSAIERIIDSDIIRAAIPRAVPGDNGPLFTPDDISPQSIKRGWKKWAKDNSAGRTLDGESLQYHHIVWQTPGNLMNIGFEKIQTASNLVRVSSSEHAAIGKMYERAYEWTGGLRLREYVETLSFDHQREIGLWVLRELGIML